MLSAPHLQTLADSERLPQGLLHWIIGVRGLYIYGGMLKRIIDPAATVPLGDVDVIALDAKVMEVMTERFGIAFRRVNTTATRTPYFIGKAGRGDAKIIHLVLLRSHEQAMRYVMNNQFDIDRLALSNHHIFCDPTLDLDTVCDAIRGKRATHIQGARDMTLFAKNRPQIEHHYEVRLRRKGYRVINCPLHHNPESNMPATIYVTLASLATMNLIAPLSYYDRLTLTDCPTTDPSHREGYYLKALSHLAASVLPEGARIALQLNAGAPAVSFPAELRGCIFEGAPHLPASYQRIIAYWSGLPINADDDCAIYYQCPSQRYEVPLAMPESSSESGGSWDGQKPIDALVSEGVVVSITGLGGLLSNAADDDFVSVVLPIDDDLLGLDNGGFLAESVYSVTAARTECIFLRVGDIRRSPDPQSIYLDILRYEELDYGFYY